MANERNTENIVRNLLRNNGYYDDDNIVIEEQSSTNPKINKLLKTASKGGRGKGYPEFIISFKDKPNDLIVIECKAKISQHESTNRDKYKDYAVDGAILYAAYLKDGFNTTAIAVSGETEREKKISSFLWLKDHYTYKYIQDKIFLSPTEISDVIVEQSKPITEDELISKAIEYNSFLHKYSIPEVERCTLISAILVALQDEPFLKSYQSYSSNKDLIANLILACKRVLESNKLDKSKVDVIIGEYSKFQNNDAFNSQTFFNKNSKKDELNTILRDFIILINENILPYINKSQFDILGKFYTQFIRYAGSDKKTGLVLTPTHITDHFCDIANLDVDDVVFDECCGTAGFLVSAMVYMLKKAGNNSEKKKCIKSKQLLGIEARPDMFSHACSNMMMRGDGKSHILYGDCFKEENKEEIKTYKPTKAFLNPPYQDGNADEQLEFIENAMDCLTKDGICVAICQMSTVVSEDSSVIEVRKRLLKSHTLEAVFSMPNELFHPVTVNTCILVFKAHNKHRKGKKSFFGYYREDGFVKTKNKGRVDKYNTWDKIKSEWLNAYLNKESIAGLSIMKEVSPEDEWCAEAYMETDYSKLRDGDFINNIHKYTSFLFANGRLEEATKKSFSNKEVTLKDRDWDWFLLNTYFPMKTGRHYPKDSFSKGYTRLVTAKNTDNGVNYWTDLEPRFKGKGITIGKIDCNTFYQSESHCISSDVTVLLNDKIINPYVAMFLVTIINMEKPKWSYGRQIRLNDSKKLVVKLPMEKSGDPDWKFMEYYIKTLPYSINLKEEKKENELSDAELVEKYEAGEINLGQKLKKTIK